MVSGSDSRIAIIKKGIVLGNRNLPGNQDSLGVVE